MLSIRTAIPWALGLLTAALCSCDARATSDRVAAPLLQPIVQGTPTTDHPAVVQLQMHLQDGPRLHCSGSLVARDRVLTAAHCLPDHFWIDDVPKKLIKVDVFFGSDASQPAVAMREAASWERNPDALLHDTLPGQDAGTSMDADAGPRRPAFGVEAYAGRYDTALVYLEEPAPESIPTLPVAFDLPSQAQLTTLPARIVGFGAAAINDDRTPVGLGVKREGTPRVLGVTEIHDELDRYTNTLEIAAAEEGGAAASCEDDSGSPLLMQLGDTWTIIATTSWGEPYCDGNVHYATLSESASFLRSRIPPNR